MKSASRPSYQSKYRSVTNQNAQPEPLSEKGQGLKLEECSNITQIADERKARANIRKGQEVNKNRSTAATKHLLSGCLSLIPQSSIHMPISLK